MRLKLKAKRENVTKNVKHTQTIRQKLEQNEKHDENIEY